MGFSAAQLNSGIPLVNGATFLSIKLPKPIERYQEYIIHIIYVHNTHRKKKLLFKIKL